MGFQSSACMHQRAGEPAWEGVCPSLLVAVAMAPAASSIPAASFRPYPAPVQLPPLQTCDLSSIRIAQHAQPPSVP